MSVLRKRTLHLGVLLILALAVMPQFSLAYRTGISPLDTGIEALSDLFNIQALNNSYIQEGFLKFAIFIVLFALSFYSLGYVFDKGGGNPQGKKTAGVISFAFSMIGVFMMPREWLMATGGTITAVMSSLVFVGVFFGGAYVAVKVKQTLQASSRTSSDCCSYCSCSSC